jgi:hypothetical protein
VGDAVYTTLPGQQVAPGLVGAVADRTDESQASDDDAAQTYFAPLACLPM